MIKRKTIDTKKIYDKYMLDYCFTRLKKLRDSWVNEENEKLGIDTIIDLGGNDFRAYKYIMEQSESIIIEMIPKLVKELMNAYEIETEWYSIRENKAKIFSIKEEENWPDYVEGADQKEVFIFSSRINQTQSMLFIFKEFGLTNGLPESLIDTIKKQSQVEGYLYISLVEDEAYREVINHNNNIKDPTRGTRRLSLKHFFDIFFDKSEYKIFKQYCYEFTNKIRDYFGFEIVRTLTPNSLHNYKKIIRKGLSNDDIKQSYQLINLSDDQKEIIDRNFFGMKNYDLLLGSSEFAQSFMTAEWLYTSLKNAGNIDLTSIALGYFKSIEQLLFSYIKLHTFERDQVVRKIFTGTLENLTDSVVIEEKKINNINLGSLVRFFGNYDKKGKLYSRNKDLMVSGLNDDTYSIIIKHLSSIPGLRNGYFHKHNLEDWSVVEDARNTTLLTYYLILGGYHLSSAEKKELGWIETVNHDDFYELCEYIHGKALETIFLDIPIIYLDETTEIYDFWFINQDFYVEFDNYGDAIYSGVYLNRPAEKNKYLKIDSDNLPNEVWEGTFRISKDLKFKPSGPQKKIFDKGKFSK